MSASVWNGTVHTHWYGKKKNHFTITTAEQLAGLAVLVNAGNDFWGKTVKLGGNIFLNDTKNWEKWENYSPDNAWTPIGTALNQFDGVFDGGGYKISGIYINNLSDYQGLFGYTTNMVDNLAVYNSFIMGKYYVGLLTGMNFGIINKCYVCGKINGERYVGGLAGYNNSGRINNCFTAVMVHGTKNSGKFVGNNSGGSIVNCYNAGGLDGIGIQNLFGMPQISEDEPEEELELEPKKYEPKMRKLKAKIRVIPTDSLAEFTASYIAQKHLLEALESGKVSDREISQMQTKDYSKHSFGIDWSLLVPEGSDCDDENKYYKNLLVKIKGQNYRMCSQWIERPDNNDRPFLLKWLKEHGFLDTDEVFEAEYKPRRKPSVKINKTIYTDIYSEFKVGEIVQRYLRQTLESGKVNDEEIILMQTKDYSKIIFGLNYPLLVKKGTDCDTSKYYKRGSIKFIKIKGVEYRLCSLWYEEFNRSLLLKWLERQGI